MARCTNLTIPRASVLAVVSSVASLAHAAVTSAAIDNADLVQDRGWRGFAFRGVHGALWGALLAYAAGLKPLNFAIGAAIGGNATYYAATWGAARASEPDDPESFAPSNRRLLYAAGAGTLASGGIAAATAYFGRPKQCLPT